MDASVLRSYPFPLSISIIDQLRLHQGIDAQPRRTEVDVWQMSISLISLLTSSLASLGQISVDIWFGDLHSQGANKFASSHSHALEQLTTNQPFRDYQALPSGILSSCQPKRHRNKFRSLGEYSRCCFRFGWGCNYLLDLVILERPLSFLFFFFLSFFFLFGKATGNAQRIHNVTPNYRL